MLNIIARLFSLSIIPNLLTSALITACFFNGDFGNFLRTHEMAFQYWQVLLLPCYYQIFAFTFFKFIFLSHLFFTLRNYFCLRLIFFLLYYISFDSFSFLLPKTCIIQFFLLFIIFSAFCIELQFLLTDTVSIFS